MTVRYDKLWILLIKNKMKKGELRSGRASCRERVYVLV